jgi:antitoxin component YwqK of YwqJK toxin-antitoxin module
MRTLLIAFVLLLSAPALAQRGVEREHDRDGGLRSTRYTKDGREYVFTYHANGKLASTSEYVGGRRDGLWKVYDEQGTLVVRACFDQGRRCGTWEFFSQAGTLRGRLTYFEGALAGGEAFDHSGTLLEARAY